MGKKEQKRTYKSMAAKGKKFLKDSAQESQGRGVTTLEFPEGTNVEFFSPKKGTNLLEIIPYEVTDPKHEVQDMGELWYQKTIWVHFGIGSNEDAFLCPNKMIHKPCPICEHIASIKKDKEWEEAKELINDIRPRRRELYNVYDLNDTDKGVQLWEISWFNFGDQLQQDVDDHEADEGWFFAAPEGGSTLRARFNEKTLGKNKFFQCTRVDFEDRDEDLRNDILDQALDLDKIVKILPYSKLASIFLEMEHEEDGEEDVPDSEDEKEPPKEERKEPPKEENQRRRRSPSQEAESSPEGNAPSNNCPEEHTFGKDMDGFEECETCEVWEDCKLEYDKLKKARKNK